MCCSTCPRTRHPEHSGEAASAVLRNLARLGDTHKAQVQKAGFVVLKSPDIPSMLVETAFISNPKEEARLDRGVSAASCRGDPRRPRPTSRASRRASCGLDDVASAGGGRTHTTVGGDTLAEIAQRYQVSLNALRSANQLQGDDIRVGQVLTIPEAVDALVCADERRRTCPSGRRRSVSCPAIWSTRLPLARWSSARPPSPRN